MTTGTVKWFNSTKVFGFIQPDNGGPDAFVHISAVERCGIGDLYEGQKLQYELVTDQRSGKTTSVQAAAPAASTPAAPATGAPVDATAAAMPTPVACPAFSRPCSRKA